MSETNLARRAIFARHLERLKLEPFTTADIDWFADQFARWPENAESAPYDIDGIPFGYWAKGDPDANGDVADQWQPHDRTWHDELRNISGLGKLNPTAKDVAWAKEWAEHPEWHSQAIDTVERNDDWRVTWRYLLPMERHAQNLADIRASGQEGTARGYAALVGLEFVELTAGVSLLEIDDESSVIEALAPLDRIPGSPSSYAELLAIGVSPEHARSISNAETKAAGFPLYVDIAALLSGDLVQPKPTLGVRSDREPFIYPEAVNVIFGPPESGKTLMLSTISADVLAAGGNVLWIDIDHNGAAATIARFRSFEVPVAVLADSSRFRLAMPEDKEGVLAVVADAARWEPTLVALDSIGELVPMFGANSNSDDDYTAVHRAVLAKMSVAGCAVVAIDHEAKGQASRDFGSGGAVAKKRAVDGVMLRASVRVPFTPGKGGKAAVTIVKDRHGGVRAISPTNGDREPLLAMFELISSGESSKWQFWAPEGASKSTPTGTDLDMLLAMHPAPVSIYDIKNRMKWGGSRATLAFKQFEAHQAGTF
jgi:hypothetical protein